MYEQMAAAKTTPRKKTRINLSKQYDLNYWKKELGVSASGLKKAVEEVGTKASDVVEHLKKPVEKVIGKKSK